MLDVLVVDVDNHRERRRPEGRKETERFQDGQGLQEPDVLLAVSARDLTREDGRGVGGQSQVGAVAARAGVSPHVGNHQGRRGEDARARPGFQHGDPPGELGEGRSGYAPATSRVPAASTAVKAAQESLAARENL